jgi:recombination protein RecA
MSPVIIENYDTIVNAINRKYTGNGIHFGDEMPDITSISTGSPELDIAMGGGVPEGRFTRFYGGYGSTKTLMAFCSIAQAQRKGLVCAYYNIEKRYEETFARKLGVNTSDLRVVEGTSIEEIGEKMEALLTVVHFHVLDSCTMGVSEDELDADLRESRPMVQARAWGKVFRRINERWDIGENTAILIDQMRTRNIGGGRAMNFVEDPAGGRVFDHQSSMSVLFAKGGWMWRDENGILVIPDDKHKAQKTKGMDEQIVPSGMQIKIRVEKSSVCRPFRTATLHYDLDTLQYDRMHEYLRAAVYYGIVEQSGAYYYYPQKNGKITLHGQKQLRDFIEKNPLLQKRVHKIALDAARAR